MGKCYTLSFDSQYSYGGANNNRRTYVVDWSFLPINGKFKVTFSYMSEAIDTVDGDINVMCLMVNLGQSSNFWSNNSTGLQSTQYVGNLKIALSSGAALFGYYFADINSNPPIYLDQRPSQNILEIQLHDGLTGVNYTTPIPGDYILTLCFEEI